MTCKVCKINPKKREEWACDEPSKTPLFPISCVRCIVQPKVLTQNCKLCGGSGKILIYRCPWAEMPDWVGEFFEVYHVCQTYKILPVAGGVYDQSAVFLDIQRIVEHENYKYEKQKKMVKPPKSKKRRR